MSFFSFLFFLDKIREQEGRIGPALGGLVPVGGGGGKKMVKEGKYGANPVYAGM
jgi:hypothetical protein